jgi:hypothetical protein
MRQDPQFRAGPGGKCSSLQLTIIFASSRMAKMPFALGRGVLFDPNYTTTNTRYGNEVTLWPFVKARIGMVTNQGDGRAGAERR